MIHSYRELFGAILRITNSTELGTLSVIAPEMKRKGIATQLLERVCKDAAQDGFDIVEAYPHKESSYQSSDFGGHFEMYRKSGFHVSLETERGLVMRKQLK